MAGPSRRSSGPTWDPPIMLPGVSPQGVPTHPPTSDTVEPSTQLVNHSNAVQPTVGGAVPSGGQLSGPLTADFELGVLNANVLVADPASGSQFDIVSVGVSCTITYANDEALGALAAKVVCTTSHDAYFGWISQFGFANDHCGSFCAFFAANPASVVRLLRVVGDVSGTTPVVAAIRLNTAGKLQLIDANGTLVATSTNAVPLNQFFRVEYHCVHDPYSGLLEIKLFSLASDTVPLETLTARNIYLSTKAQQVHFGLTSVTGSVTAWFDKVTAANVAYPGPWNETYSRAITDTGLTVTESIVLLHTPVGPTDTGLAVSDSLALEAIRPLTDTGLSVTDSLARQALRPLTDTGLAVTDSIASKSIRPLADTGLTVSDSLATKALRPLSDTGLSISDSLAREVIRPLTDTGLSISDSLSLKTTRPLSDTGLSVSDALALAASRVLADTGLSVSDALARVVRRPLADTGLTVSDSLALLSKKPLTDTGLAVTDALALAVAHALADRGVTVTDVLTTERLRALADQGVSITDFIGGAAHRGLTDTALTITDTLVKGGFVGRTITDTGLVVSDDLKVIFIPFGPPAPHGGGVGGSGFSPDWLERLLQQNPFPAAPEDDDEEAALLVLLDLL